MLPETSTLAVFVVAAVVMLVTPGPAVLYIVARSVDQGRLAGIVSTLGIGVGTLFHVAAAALGVSAVLVSSALAFGIVKYLGAAYLVYLGLVKLLDRGRPNEAREPDARSLRDVFVQGVVVNVLNPKTALFFFAFLPQFIDVSRGSVAAQIVFLGVLFVFLGMLSDGLWALLAGTAGDWLRGNLRVLRIQRYFSGGVLVALGITTALSGSTRK